MTNCGCRTRLGCTLLAAIAAVILGIVAGFLQITAVITVTPLLLWVALAIAVVYLAVLTVVTGMAPTGACRPCMCATLNTVLAGILATALFAVVLLAVGITATSVASAILVGLLTASLTLTLASSACLIKCMADCEG